LKSFITKKRGTCPPQNAFFCKNFRSLPFVDGHYLY
jgi:hypothetical protein